MRRVTSPLLVRIGRSEFAPPDPADIALSGHYPSAVLKLPGDRDVLCERVTVHASGGGRLRVEVERACWQVGGGWNRIWPSQGELQLSRNGEKRTVRLAYLKVVVLDPRHRSEQLRMAPMHLWAEIGE